MDNEPALLAVSTRWFRWSQLLSKQCELKSMIAPTVNVVKISDEHGQGTCNSPMNLFEGSEMSRFLIRVSNKLREIRTSARCMSRYFLAESAKAQLCRRSDAPHIRRDHWNNRGTTHGMPTLISRTPCKLTPEDRQELTMRKSSQ